MEFHKRLFILLVISVSKSLENAPEEGIFMVTMSPDVVHMSASKTLYAESTIKITITKSKDNCVLNDPINFNWLVRGTTCYHPNQVAMPRSIIEKPYELPINASSNGQYVANYYYNFTTETFVGGDLIKCGDNILSASDNWQNFRNETKSKVHENMPTPVSRRRRDENTGVVTVKPEDKVTTVVVPVRKLDPHVITEVPFKGVYFVMLFLSEIKHEDQFSFDVKLEMKGPMGYLSAHEFPLLTFYMIMCIIYSLYGLIWLFLSACNYRDLLRVQFWIGGVILLGMIEKAAFYSEYLSVDTTGVSVVGATKFAEIVSVCKRSVARMLVIIVSLGFGIVKPRLGPMLHRVIGVGVLYFILATIEAMVRSSTAAIDNKNSTLMFTFIPLAVLDSIICWWVFMSLMQTMKTLRLRRNTAKLSLYRHFSNTIVFCVIASIVMILWSINLRRKVCIYAWSELWLDQAFWHILFSVILMVIMVLWRPNANNQRYAYSPMIDGNESEEDAEEPMLGGGATETVKMRGKKSDYDKVATNTADDDLKWIEENIPQTIADAALPVVMDSDEEEMTTKYEMSKME